MPMHDLFGCPPINPSEIATKAEAIQGLVGISDAIGFNEHPNHARGMGGFISIATACITNLPKDKDIITIGDRKDIYHGACIALTRIPIWALTPRCAETVYQFRDGAKNARQACLSALQGRGRRALDYPSDVYIRHEPGLKMEAIKFAARYMNTDNRFREGYLHYINNLLRMDFFPLERPPTLRGSGELRSDIINYIVGPAMGYLGNSYIEPSFQYGVAHGFRTLMVLFGSKIMRTTPLKEIIEEAQMECNDQDALERATEIADDIPLPAWDMRSNSFYKQFVSEGAGVGIAVDWPTSDNNVYAESAPPKRGSRPRSRY